MSNEAVIAAYEALTGEEAPNEVENLDEDLKQTEGSYFKMQLKCWNGEKEVEVEFEVKNANFDVSNEQFESTVSNVGQVALMQIVEMLRTQSSTIILPFAG